MAFHLNVRGSYPTSARTESTAAQILRARKRLRVSGQIGYLASPSMHLMSAVLMFFAGVTIASLRLGQLATSHVYDMTPTGSIAVKAGAEVTKVKSCP